MADLNKLAQEIPQEVTSVILYHIDQIRENCNLKGQIDDSVLHTRTINDLNYIQALITPVAGWSNSASNTKELEAQANAAKVTGVDAEGKKLDG